MAEKIYYWLKLKNDFFRQKEIKRLRGIAGGEVFVIIYLKMLLLSLDNDGFLLYEKYYDTFAEELADQIDEKADNVKIVIAFLLSVGLLVEVDESSYLLTKCEEMTGHETSAAVRKRRSREKQKLLQAENSENALLEQSEQNNQGNISQNVTMSRDSHTMSRDSHIEKEIEKEKEIDIIYGQKNLTEKQNQQNSDVETVENLDAAFERIWKQYPRKQGKQEAKRYFMISVKTGDSVDDIENGVKKYAEHVKALKCEFQFIKKGSNFFREKAWMDDYSVTWTATNKKSSYDLGAVKSYAVPFEVEEEVEEVSYDINEFDKFAITHSSNTKKKE